MKMGDKRYGNCMEQSDAIPSEIIEFSRLVETEGLHGLYFQHISLCTRRAWFHLNRIDYAHLDERMANGTVMHETSRPRDRSVEGLIGLAPDRIDWQNRIVVEAKARSGAKTAVSRQTAFYALLLWASTGQPWRAQNDIIEERRSRPVVIDREVVDDMLDLAHKLAALNRQSDPPPAKRKKLCTSCSYRFLCGMT